MKTRRAAQKEKIKESKNNVEEDSTEIVNVKDDNADYNQVNSSDKMVEAFSDENIEEKNSCDEEDDNSDKKSISDDKEENKDEDTDDDDDESVESDESDDDAPEGLSLKASKEIAHEIREKQIQSMLHMKEQRKRKQLEWEERNKEQQKQKKKLRTDQISALIPAKLDEKVLELVDQEIDVNEEDFSVSLAPKQNTKVYFADAADSNEDEGFSDEYIDSDNNNSMKIKVQRISDVEKSSNGNVQDFLKNHFYGTRIMRENLKSANQGNKRKSKKRTDNAPHWLKKRNKRV